MWKLKSALIPLSSFHFAVDFAAIRKFVDDFPENPAVMEDTLVMLEICRAADHFVFAPN